MGKDSSMIARVVSAPSPLTLKLALRPPGIDILTGFGILSSTVAAAADTRTHGAARRVLHMRNGFARPGDRQPYPNGTIVACAAAQWTDSLPSLSAHTSARTMTWRLPGRITVPLARSRSPRAGLRKWMV